MVGSPSKVQDIVCVNLGYMVTRLIRLIPSTALRFSHLSWSSLLFLCFGVSAMRQKISQGQNGVLSFFDRGSIASENGPQLGTVP